MPDCSVIIPVFNRAALTAQCLAAVAGTPDTEIIVVDDASTDGTDTLLAAPPPGVRVLTHAVNGGFARSCNHGAAVARGDFLIFLNNDTLPEPGWRDALVHYAGAHPNAAAIGAKLLYPNDTIQHAGVVVCQDRYPRHIYSGFPSDHPAVNKSRRFQIVTGACLLVRRAVFEELGGFDESYRNGFEDVDLCLRLGAAGHEVHYCSGSVVRHLESVSPGRHARDRDNVALYRERWFGRVRPDDLEYYVADGLLQVRYEGRYPVGLAAAPELAVFEGEVRTRELERALRDRGREVADLLRENVTLRTELGEHCPGSDFLQYERVCRGLREWVSRTVPAGASMLVVSKGDGALLRMGDRVTGHFPQGPDGVYAGHHPADSERAIRHLEELCDGGARYLLVPETMLWWLDHYQGFALHLSRHARLVAQNPGVGIVYELYPGTLRPSGTSRLFSDQRLESQIQPCT